VVDSVLAATGKQSVVCERSADTGMACVPAACALHACFAGPVVVCGCVHACFKCLTLHQMHGLVAGHGA
jgi:hypothetical protein